MSKLEHTRGLAEMYQRLMPDTSKTLQEVAARVLAEIEAAEIELDTIAALTADRDRLAGELAQAREVLEKIVKDCKTCGGDGEIEYQPDGLDGWLPTGDANFVHEDCPSCSAARAALHPEPK